MKAAVYYGVHDVRITDFDEPPMQSNSVKIMVHSCGICGTDIHKYNGKGGSRPLIPPVVLGHEASGTIVELGRDVHTFHIGERVVVDPNWSCGYCRFCQEGMTHMCENSRGVVKGFAEFICPPQENVYRIPNNLSMTYATLAEPLSCCLHAMDQLHMQLGDTVLIIGAGSIGCMMIQLCAKAGATDIIVIEPIKEKQALALELGATYVLNPDDDIVEFVKQNRISNINKVIECVGARRTIEDAFGYAGRCAKIMLFGLSDPSDPPSINQYNAFQKELTIFTSFVNPHTMARAIRLLQNKMIDCDRIISKEISLGDVVEELHTLHYFKKGKVIVNIENNNNSYRT